MIPQKPCNVTIIFYYDLPHAVFSCGESPQLTKHYLVLCFKHTSPPTLSPHHTLTITGESIRVEGEAILATTCIASLSIDAHLITVISQCALINICMRMSQLRVLM